jgi:hypothetical protein
MKKNQLLNFVLPLLILSLTVSCKKEVCDAPRENEKLVYTASSAVRLETSLLKSVRRATARFHSTSQAIAAGYLADDHCVSVPGLGGMGYHWVNPLLVDPIFDPLKPEAILYATGPDRNLRLVAVEYIVIDAGQAQPMFGDQLFDVGGTPVPASHWSLHVWIHEDNPSGMFTPFNPNISCP